MDSANWSLIENETYGAKIQGSDKNIWGTIYYYSSHEAEKQSEWVQLVTSTSTNIFPNLKGQMDVILDYKTYMYWSSSSEIDVPLRICYSAMRKILTMKQMWESSTT